MGYMGLSEQVQYVQSKGLRGPYFHMPIKSRFSGEISLEGDLGVQNKPFSG